MNKIKIMVLTVLVMVLTSFGGVAQADGIGFINYKKIQDNYSFAKDAIKEVDAKGLELQQYLVDKEKEFKALDTPVKKKNFEEKTAKEFKVKQDAYLNLKAQKEEAVYNKIQDAAKQVLIEQKLDAIVDFRIIFVGGIDISDLVIQKLNGGK
ncbi:MAG: OmpH family outer membrane protein [Candidatus Gastranaerophilaceae bacterium]